MRSSFASDALAPPLRPPPASIPSIDTIIMTGNSRDIGLRAMPEENISATMPIMATTMITGSSLVSRFPGVTRGISGGA